MALFIDKKAGCITQPAFLENMRQNESAIFGLEKRLVDLNLVALTQGCKI